MIMRAPEPCMKEKWEEYQREFEERGLSYHGAGTLKKWQWQGDELCKEKDRIEETTFFYMDDEDTLVGTVNIRLGLNAYLYQEIGHIGYSIRPSQQGKGYGTRLLMEALNFCRFIGFDRVLIVCLSSNKASVRVIEKCGGVLEDEVESTKNGQKCKRFWIKL